MGVLFPLAKKYLKILPNLLLSSIHFMSCNIKEKDRDSLFQNQIPVNP